MNRAQSVQALTKLAVALHHELADDEIELWCNAVLDSCPLDVARTAIDRMILEVDRWYYVTPAKFTTYRRAVERADEGRIELPAARQSVSEREQIARLIAETRSSLGAMRANASKHWHGGPNPCEVCGGMKGELGRWNGKEYEL